ncbi:XRE family transcriptional regulator [Streptococcus suis]|nr:XRE family transcriptional regulator [Streptococcus suis]NQJ76065.1 XRE family transcriptional regulator [Streptococcus suis]
MVNINRLKGLIVEKQATHEGLASELGINRTTFYRRMNNGGTDFTVYEVQKIVESLALTKEEAMSIFFPIFLDTKSQK